MKAHFVANIDPDDLDRTLAALNPETTLVIICSKSFSTEETLSNARRASDWLQSVAEPGEALGRHLMAVTTQVAEAGEWHIPPERCFPLWDWVGGRYSVWSAIGISIALGLGWAPFQRFLEGARRLDEHAQRAAQCQPADGHGAARNMANPLSGRNTHVVLPYAQKLAHLPDFCNSSPWRVMASACRPRGNRSNMTLRRFSGALPGPSASTPTTNCYIRARETSVPTSFCRCVPGREISMRVARWPPMR